MIKQVRRAILTEASYIKRILFGMCVFAALLIWSTHRSHVELTQRASAQSTGAGGGLYKCTSSGLLSGSCVGSSPLTATISVDGTSVTGTGSAGSPLSSVIPSSVYTTAMEGVYGPGTDGAITLDGVATITLGGGVDQLTGPVAGTGIWAGYNLYTLATSGRDVLATNLTVNSGVALDTRGNRIFVKGTLTNNGLIGHSGADSTGIAATTGALGGTCGGGSAGGAAGAIGTAITNAVPDWTSTNTTSNAGAANTTGTAGQVTFKGGGGGGSSVGVGFTGGSITVAAASAGRMDFYAMHTCEFDDRGLVRFPGGSGGGGGGNAATGGGGGAGAGSVAIYARIIAGTGEFRAKGGNGFGATAGTGGGGGGGGGGYVLLMYSHRQGSTTTTVTGGTGGAAFAGTNKGGNGAAGLVTTMNLSGDGT